MIKINCPKCKNPIGDKTKQCSSCGYQISDQDIAFLKGQAKKLKRRRKIGCFSVIVIWAILVILIDSPEKRSDTPYMAFFNKSVQIEDIDGIWIREKNGSIERFTFSPNGLYAYQWTTSVGTFYDDGRWAFIDSNTIQIYLNSGDSFSAHVGVSENKSQLYYMDEEMAEPLTMQKLRLPD